MFQIEICSQQLEICITVCMFIDFAIDDDVSTHTFLTMIIDESVCFMSCEPIFFCNYSFVLHTDNIFISIFIFHSGIRAKSSNYYYRGTIQGNCVPAHREEKTYKVAFERNFWKHVLLVNVSGSICSILCVIKKR
jgi:hypothetical protein